MYDPNIPEYQVDLSRDERDRWSDVIAAERKSARALGRQALKDADDAVQAQVTWLPRSLRGTLLSLAAPVVRQTYALAGGLYVGEMDAWSDALDMNRGYSTILNCTYELAMMCTAGVVMTPKGPVHVRSVDWPLTKIGPATCIFHFKKGAHRFVAVGLAGHVGVLSGMVPGAYSITMNYAPSDGLSLDYGPSFYLRFVFETCKTYAQAVSALQSVDLAAAAFFVVCGVKPGEACVVERTRQDCAVRRIVGKVLTQANHHETTKFKERNEALTDFDPETEEMSVLDYSILRAQTLKSALQWHEKEDDPRKVASALDAEPVCNDNSFQQMVFSPKTGELQAWRWV